MRHWLKSRKGIALLVTILAIVAFFAVFYLSRSALPGLPPDRVETLVVRHENEPSFDISPMTKQGHRLLPKCEEVLLNLWSQAMGFEFDDGITTVKKMYAHVEIVFKENYDVPIHTRFPSQSKRMPASGVMFVLSGEFKGFVFFRSTTPILQDNVMTFVWTEFGVSSDDPVGWPIFQELVEMANEIQSPNF